MHLSKQRPSLTSSLLHQSNKNEIVIAGDQNAINAAKERIYEIYNNKKQNCESIHIVIKKCQHKYIIGPKGSVLNDIFKTTGVSIEMPTDPDSEQIILRGEQEKLGKLLRDAVIMMQS